MKAILVLAFLTLFSSGAFADSDCHDELVRDTYSNQGGTGSDWRLASLVSEGEYNKITHDGSIRTFIYGAPTFGKYGDFKEHVEHQLSTSGESLSQTQWWNIAWTGLTGASVSAYKACLEAQSGTRLIVDRATRDTILLRLRYIGPTLRSPTITWTRQFVGNVSLPTRMPDSLNLLFEVPRPSVEIPLAATVGDQASPSISIGPLPPPPPSWHEIVRYHWNLEVDPDHREFTTCVSDERGEVGAKESCVTDRSCNNFALIKAYCTLRHGAGYELHGETKTPLNEMWGFVIDPNRNWMTTCTRNGELIGTPADCQGDNSCHDGAAITAWCIARYDQD